MTKNRKVALVTGVTGQDGAYLAELLLNKGYIVHGIKRRTSLFNTDRIDHLYKDSHEKEVRFFLHHGDMTDSSSLIRIIQQVQPDEIYNLACPAAPGHYQFNPIKTIKTSVLGAIHVLGMAKRCRAKVLQASTSEVYGDPEVHPQPESYRGSVNPIGLRACYDEGKRAAETLFMDYHRTNNVNVRIVRIFNTYGPRMHPFDGRVVSNFIRQAIHGEDITLFGDGSQTRSFCYRDDLVEAIIRMMHGPDDLVGPVNIGNPNEFTIRELAELVIELTNAGSKIVNAPLPADDPTRRRPDISLAKARLDWQPTIELREGLARTVEWFRGINLDSYRPPTPNF